MSNLIRILSIEKLTSKDYRIVSAIKLTFKTYEINIEYIKNVTGFSTVAVLILINLKFLHL